MNAETLRYPIGQFTWPGPSATRRRADIAALAELPGDLRAAVAGLPEELLDTPYRPGGWTGRQVVHHLADSHVNAYVRCKLALTETEPTIRPYEQSAWSELADAHAPVDGSLRLLEALHERWVTLLRSLDARDFERTFVHPELEGTRTLDWLAAQYAWHGRHHLAHLRLLERRPEP